MKEKRARKGVCRGVCKSFALKEPANDKRCEGRQDWCRICDVWTDYRGGHLKDGTPASNDSEQVYCNCCDFLIRKGVTNLKYRSEIQAKDRNTDNDGSDEIDLSYISKTRARLLSQLGEAIAKKKDEKKSVWSIHHDVRPITGIEEEFGVTFERILKLARTEEANKVSLITEFERIKHMIGRVPTKQDMGMHSLFGLESYEREFSSWEHLLERLGHDPWYRDADTKPVRRDTGAPYARKRKDRKRSAGSRKKGGSKIPTHEDLLLPVLKICKDGKRYTIRKVSDILADQFDLTERQRNTMLHENETLLSNRTSWTVTYLRRAGLLGVERGLFSITAEGKSVLRHNPAKIDKKFLSQLPSFKQFYDKGGSGKAEIKSEHPESKGQDASDRVDADRVDADRVDADRVNRLIDKSLRFIKSSPDGVYVSDLRMLLKISQEEMSANAKRLVRIEGVSKEELSYDGVIQDTLLRYAEPAESS